MPRSTAFGVGVGANSHASQSNAPEEEAGGVEVRDRPGQTAYDTHFAQFAKSLNHFGQQLAADVIDGQIYTPHPEHGLNCLTPFRVRRIERRCRTQFAKLAALCLAARQSHDAAAHRTGKLNGGYAHPTRSARHQHHRRGSQWPPHC